MNALKEYYYVLNIWKYVDLVYVNKRGFLMGKYICDKCGAEESCESNASGFGYCSTCAPQVKKDLEEMPQAGSMEDIPDKYKYLLKFTDPSRY